MTDDELEQRITEAGRRMLEAHAAGDLVMARVWLDTEMALVKQRSPARVAQMEADYFMAQGDRARALAGASK